MQQQWRASMAVQVLMQHSGRRLHAVMQWTDLTQREAEQWPCIVMHDLFWLNITRIVHMKWCELMTDYMRASTIDLSFSDSLHQLWNGSRSAKGAGIIASVTDPGAKSPISAGTATHTLGR